MSRELFKFKLRRKTKIHVLYVELFRRRGEPEWRLSINYGGRRTIVDTHTAMDAAAIEFARATIRHITRASSQQPAASSQQPAASSQQPLI